MNSELQKQLESLPSDESRSRLEPFRALILRWRREGRSYRRIQQILAEKCQITVSHKAVIKFVKRRARPGKIESGEPSTTTAIETRMGQQKPGSAGHRDQGHGETNSGDRPLTAIPRSAEYLAKLAHMQALKAMPVATVTVHKRYVYNPDEPLILEKPEENNR